MESKYTAQDLKEMQAWSLERKIQVAQTRILEFGVKLDKQIYVAFSGGKDSTVLLDLVRRVFPETPAVFSDTGLEYPEIRDFVKTVENVTWVKPIKWDKHKREFVRTSFKEVINQYGYPIVSKEICEVVAPAKKNIAAGRLDTLRVKKLRGQNECTKSRYNCSKWAFLLDAPFDVNNKCCDYMKKSPMKLYEKRTGRHPIIGTMAAESFVRRNRWLLEGCNNFTGRITSKPLSFWTEQDVLRYIKNFNLPYASRIYGDIVQDAAGSLYTTGANRTGCVFCGFGAHLEKEPNRYQRLKKTHPQLWEYCMKPKEQGGLGMRVALEYIGVKVEDDAPEQLELKLEE